MSELEEKVEAQSREMEALQTQNNDLNTLVKVSLVASVTHFHFNLTPVSMWEVEQGPGNEASRVVHFLNLIPRLLGRAWE